MAKKSFKKVTINELGGLHTGDIVITPAIGKPRAGLIVKRPLPKVVLPERTYTMIRSTWKGTAGLADFDAILLPAEIGPLLRSEYRRPRWLDLANILWYTPEQLAAKIDSYVVTGQMQLQNYPYASAGKIIVE